MVRNPLKVIPSVISLNAASQQLFGSSVDPYQMKDFLYKAILHWYRCVAVRLEEWGHERMHLIRYESLVQNSEQILHNVYMHHGLFLNEKFLKHVREEGEKIRRFKSNHIYCLEKTGILPDRIIEDCGDICSLFTFDLSADEALMPYGAHKK